MRRLTRLETVVATISGCYFGNMICPGDDPISITGAIFISLMAGILFGFAIFWIKNDGGISW